MNPPAKRTARKERKERVYILESQSNDGQWHFHLALNASAPLDAWHESAVYIKTHAHRFGPVWKLRNGQMNPNRWRVVTVYFTVDPKRRPCRRFQAVDLEVS